MLTKVSISLPGELLAEIDELAEERQLPRSALVQESLERLLNEECQRRTLALARELYAEIAAEDVALSEAYRPLAIETLPPSPLAEGEGAEDELPSPR
ncbi:MAG: ribbon-helix-helix domain-containing protein [Chloroflexota bacterium]|nr:ribbon-helix-helix domain-containing protein [Chloroflexota bacterium]